VTTFQWLLGFHLVGAFMFVSGGVAVGVLELEVMRRERPSEIAPLLGFMRIAVAVAGIGSLLALGFGLWLVDEGGFDWGDAWISAAIVLWFVGGALGGIGGRSSRETRYLAERLAVEDDRPSPELRRALVDPVTRALNWGSFLTTLAILGLMIWKPGV
jgi:uncharacterized membrane protein